MLCYDGSAIKLCDCSILYLNHFVSQVMSLFDLRLNAQKKKHLGFAKTVSKTLPRQSSLHFLHELALKPQNSRHALNA